jgi:RNA polymerase sigma factor (sigma-70 family)
LRTRQGQDDVIGRLWRGSQSWPPPVVEDLDRHLVDDERLRRALVSLSELSSRDRDVLELAVWSGLSETEMAEALDVPVGTLKSRLSRARRRLRERCEMPNKLSPLVRFAINSEELR